jgi:hypothetical protein
MIEFEQEAIANTKGYIEAQQFPLQTVEVDGISYQYAVLPQNLNPNLPDFAFRMTGKTPDGKTSGIFGVCESVPRELQPFWVAHEIREFIDIGIDSPGRCQQAERTTIESLPTELRIQYIERRKIFFTNLERYFLTDMQTGSGNFNEGDLEELHQTQAYLNTL